MRHGPHLSAARSIGLLAVGAILTITGCVGESGGLQQIEGELKTTILTNVDSGSTGTEYFLEDARGDWIRLHFNTEPASLADVSRIRVRGVWGSQPLHFNVSSLELPDPERTGALAPTPPVVRKVAVIMANFQNDTRQMRTEDEVRSIVFTAPTSANAYFKEESFQLRSLTGKLRPDGDVFGWYTIAQASTTCDYSSWGTAARAAAQAAGVNLSGYDHIVHYFPQVNCGWGGVGQLPGQYSWLSNSMASTTAHELSHNFGLHHASTWSCTNAGVRVPISASCTLNEYGDPFDVMGMGYRHGSAYQKARLGFFGPSNVATATTAGTFDIVPIENSSNGLQALRVPRPDKVTYYYVEYRQPFGFDNFPATHSAVNGVLIHLALDYTKLDRPKLLDMTPATNIFTDAALGVGQTFSDPASGISIKLNSRTAASANVSVTFSSGGTDGGTGGPDAGGGGPDSGGGSADGGTGGTGGGGMGTGLTGEYFDNENLTTSRGSRLDPTVNFNWGAGSPLATVAADTFSARWTGFVQAPLSGATTFYTTSDDGVRLWVNGQLLIDNWTDHGPTENSATIMLTAGQKASIRMEYYERGGGAVATLSWSSAGQIKQIIPASRLFPN